MNVSMCLAGGVLVGSAVIAADSLTINVEQDGKMNEFKVTRSTDGYQLEYGKNRRDVKVLPHWPVLRSGNLQMDALYAMSLDDGRLNSVNRIRNGNFTPTAAFDRPYFQTGAKWTHVWTRDISYSIDLGMGAFDQSRSVNSLLFKTARLKDGLEGSFTRQVVQDTGTGGSYPVSSDRVVWSLAAEELIN